MVFDLETSAPWETVGRDTEYVYLVRIVAIVTVESGVLDPGSLCICGDDVNMHRIQSSTCSAVESAGQSVGCSAFRVAEAQRARSVGEAIRSNSTLRQRYCVRLESVICSWQEQLPSHNSPRHLPSYGGRADLLTEQG